MENVHKSAIRSWIDGKINLREYLIEWKNLLSFRRKYETKSATEFNSCEPSTSMQLSCRKKLRELVSEREFMEIEKECGLESMKCEHPDVDLIQNHAPEGTDLTTVKLQIEDLHKRKSDPQYENLFYNNQKFVNYPPNKIEGLNIVSDDIPFEAITGLDLMLTVQVYRPEKKGIAYRQTQSRFPTFQVDQEFLVLGSQFLTELRDKIDCVSDKAIPGDFSECPNMKSTDTCKELYKSGFFYFGDTFYNDMRDPDCRDYSKTITDWAEKRNGGIGPFRKCLMEKSRFIDLTIQLGYPYVYIHQGNCEHLTVFSDLNVHTDHFPQNRNIYPLHLTLRPKKCLNCMACHLFTAAWVVYDNDRLPENPFFFCKKCFISFNYDEEDKKIGKFRAYHFADRSSLT